jgi:8-oxo-dGTP pyrophosphatase MutT (NUDIX family)
MNGNGLVMKFFIMIFYTIFFFIKKGYQNIFGIRTNGARAVVINEHEEILLVLHSYIPGWHFPGGGVDKGESPREAIIREVREEAGIIVKETPCIFDCYYNKIAGVDDIVSLYIIKNFECQSFKSSEILEAKWFARDQLPKDISSASQRRINEVFYNQKKIEKW